MALILASATGVLDGDRARYVHVRWRPDVGDEARGDLEARFSLLQPQRLDGNTFGYDLGNETWWNIRGLVLHPAVVDTQNLDRQRFRVAETADEGDTGRRTGLAWRWGVENLIPYAVPFGSLLVVLGALVQRPHVPRRFSVEPIRRYADRLSGLTGILRAGLPRRLPLALPATLAVLALRLFAESPAGEPDAWMPWLELQSWAPVERFVAAALLAAGTVITIQVPILRFGSAWAGLVLLFGSVWAWPASASAAGFCLYALVVWAATRPTNARIPDQSWLLLILTAVVFAARADQGLYVAAAAIAGLFARHYREGKGAFRTASIAFAGSLAVIALAFAPLGDVPGSLSRLGDRIGEVVAAQPPPSDSADAQQSNLTRPVGPTFNIRWAPLVDSAQRVAKEKQYALPPGNADPDDESGQTWRYEWDDRLAAGLLQMLEDPAIEDTHGIDRKSGRYVGTAPSQDDVGLFAVLRSWAGAIGRAAATSGPKLLWVLLPLCAAFRLVRRNFHRRAGHTYASADMVVLPALILCLPVAWSALQDAGAFARIAAPAIPALVVVVAWVLAPADRMQTAFEIPSPSESSARPTDASSARRKVDGYIYGGLVALTVLVHLYVNSDLLNDHAAYLAMARQIVYGDWPIRDFRDDGSLLQILLSAGVQKIGGFRLLGEMLLAWAFLAAANCLTFRLAVRLSGSRATAAVATVLALLLVPRPYGYPKIFIYPLAILALWRYLESPGVGRLAAVAATTALAFLFRIDHGVVIAATSVMTLAAIHARQPRIALRQSLMFAGWLLLFALPQALYVIWSVGLRRYAESILTFGAYANATREPWPSVFLSLPEGLLTEANAAVWLFCVFVAIVAIALVRAVIDAFRAWSRGSELSHDTLHILVVGAMWALMLPMLARGQYYTRIAEIGQPVAILGAWVATRWLALDLRPVVQWSTLGTIVAATVIALCCRTPVARFFTDSADVFRGAPFQSEVLSGLATSPPIDAFAPASLEGSTWLVRYADLCTKPDDRLLVTWFGPEVYLYAGRAFAGDRWVYLPFDNSPDRQRQVVERLRSQSVPVVFVDPELYAAFNEAWPAIAAYFDLEYTVAADVQAAGQVTRVLAWKRRAPSRRLSFGNLPCFD